MGRRPLCTPPPPKPEGRPQLHRQFPHRAQRYDELALIHILLGNLQYLWALNRDPATTMAAVIRSSDRRLSKRQRQAAITELSAAIELGPDGADVEMVPLFLAATSWICSLGLPASESELWTGPPLFQRRRLAAVTVNLPAEERMRSMPSPLIA